MARKFDYGELYFGLTDSVNEANENRTAFVDSFVNIDDHIGKITSGSRHLVLGPKGAGKSSIAWYLKSTETTSSYSVLIRDAATLPLDAVPQMRTGQPPGYQRTVTAWTFVLLCNYLELLFRDTSSTIQVSSDADRVYRALRDLGFIGDATGRTLLNTATQTLTVPIPTLGEVYRRENSPALNIFHLTPYLMQWACSARGAKFPLLLLDGLDSIFLNDEKYKESLSSLVQATYNINQSLRHANAPGSCVLLMRNDVFSRIATRVPDSQKMRSDRSVQLDWRILSGSDSLDSPLFNLVNSKAGGALGAGPIEVLNYFEKDVQLGNRNSAPRWIRTPNYLLNFTRHTPRDILQLLESIRGVHNEQGSRLREGRLLRETVREGILRYSNDYFRDAIKNELAGPSNESRIAEASISALRHLPRAEFDRHGYAKALRQEVGDFSNAEVSKCLRLLFMAGAIGNKVARSGGADRDPYMQFYHRRDDLDIHLGGRFVLANALVFAWSLPF